MTNPLLEQFQNWINQLESNPQAPFSGALLQWQQWLSKFNSQSDQLSPNHADLVQKLSDYSGELMELLADLTRAQARGVSTEHIAEKLRSELHQFNLKHILDQATLPHQFLDLLLTQNQPGYTLSEEQLSQLKGSLEQFKHPRFAQLKALIEALIEWGQASHCVSQELDRVSNSAIERYRSLADETLEQEALLNLWVQCYDQSYRDAFNSDPLQQAQARLVNALAGLQLSWQNLIDHFAEQLGLPSRKQVDQLIEEFDLQRRRIRHLEIELQSLKATLGAKG